MATENDKVNTGALATLVIVGTAAMIGVSLAVNALVRHEIGSIGAARDEVGADAYRTLRNEQLEKLSAPAAWSSKEKAQVSIPIERAMSLVLADLKKNPWNATPSPPPDAGAELADAGAELADAGADAAAEAADAGADSATSPAPDAGAAPEPPAPAPLSPGAPSAAPPSEPKAPPTAPPASPAPPATP